MWYRDDKGREYTEKRGRKGYNGERKEGREEGRKVKGKGKRCDGVMIMGGEEERKGRKAKGRE